MRILRPLDCSKPFADRMPLETLRAHRYPEQLAAPRTLRAATEGVEACAAFVAGPIVAHRRIESARGAGRVFVVRPAQETRENQTVTKSGRCGKKNERRQDEPKDTEAKREQHPQAADDHA